MRGWDRDSFRAWQVQTTTKTTSYRMPTHNGCTSRWPTSTIWHRRSQLTLSSRQTSPVSTMPWTSFLSGTSMQRAEKCSTFSFRTWMKMMSQKLLVRAQLCPIWINKMAVEKKSWKMSWVIWSWAGPLVSGMSLEWMKSASSARTSQMITILEGEILSL